MAESEHQAIRDRYTAERGRYLRLETSLRDQIGHALRQKNISLGVPIESRTKSPESIIDKIVKRQACNGYDELTDIVGVRCILLFRSDLSAFDAMIKDTFNVISHESVGERLDPDQFGYQSNHYIVTLPEGWLSLPSFEGLSGIRAEIQARTIAQHIWAAASHKLQYKREESVPLPLRRSISRVAALLETVDLEFERFLSEREDYVSTIDRTDDATLNVDLLQSELNAFWPSANEFPEQQNNEELLTELFSVGIDTKQKLSSFLNTWRNQAMEEERLAVAKYVQEPSEQNPWIDQERLANGVYFTHVGLTRCALKAAHEAGEIEWPLYVDLGPA